MPEGINRDGKSYRNGVPVTWPTPDPEHFGTPINEPHDFGNDVNWTPSPAHFGNPVTWLPSPAHFGNKITPPLPAPTLASLSVSTGPIAGGTSVTLTGTGFVAGATVLFGTTPGTSVVVVSSTSITVVTPAESAGVVSVTVTNIDSQSATLPAAFTFTAATPAVFIASITVQGTNNSLSGNTPVGGSINTTGATVLIAALRANANPYTPVSGTNIIDSMGNTWLFTTFAYSGNHGISNAVAGFAYCSNPITSAAHTFEALGNYLTMDVYAFSGGGVGGWAFDQFATTPGPESGPVTCGPITPSQTGEIILGVIASFNEITEGTVNNGFSGGVIGDPADQARFIGFTDNDMVGSSAYLIDAADAPISAVFQDTGGNSDYTGALASFKPL
jgi:hypothetical protein